MWLWVSIPIVLDTMANTSGFISSPPKIAIRLIFGVAGLALGLDSAVETRTLFAIAKTLLGIWTGLTIIVWGTAYYVSLFAVKQWQKTGIRVAGSWIMAASLMILAFAFRR